MNICLNFKERFAPAVESGEKLQSIRMDGKRVAEVGDVIHLFTGMRTKACRKLGDGRCVFSERIYIDTKRCFLLSRIDYPEVMYGFRQTLEIAKLDGFTDVGKFFEFFRQQYGDGIHEMRLYRWEYLPGRGGTNAK